MKQPGPDHPITITPFAGRVRVTAAGETIADTGHALVLAEASLPKMFYIPRGDVRMERLAASDHATHCPYKGDASYFHLPGGEGRNAVWSYADPYPAVAAIGGHLAFYPNKVTIETAPMG